jgi:hypothetical protein
MVIEKRKEKPLPGKRGRAVRFLALMVSELPVYIMCTAKYRGYYHFSMPTIFISN